MKWKPCPSTASLPLASQSFSKKERSHDESVPCPYMTLHSGKHLGLEMIVPACNCQEGGKREGYGKLGAIWIDLLRSGSLLSILEVRA